MKKIWTEDKLKWLISSKEIYCDREDILNAFNKEFDCNVTFRMLKSAIRYYNIELPIAYRIRRKNLEKGFSKLRNSVTKNIGEEVKYRNGSDRICVKISNSKNRSEAYIEKRRYLYEKYHNVKLGKDDLIIFLNGDKTDYSKSNLYRINRSINTYILFHLNEKTDIETITKIKYAEWKEKLSQLKEGEMK